MAIVYVQLAYIHNVSHFHVYDIEIVGKYSQKGECDLTFLITLHLPLQRTNKAPVAINYEWWTV